MRLCDPDLKTVPRPAPRPHILCAGDFKLDSVQPRGDSPTEAHGAARKVTGSRFPAGRLGQTWAPAGTETQKGLETPPGCTARAPRGSEVPKRQSGSRDKTRATFDSAARRLRCRTGGGGPGVRSQLGLKCRQSPAAAQLCQLERRGRSAEVRKKRRNGARRKRGPHGRLCAGTRTPPQAPKLRLRPAGWGPGRPLRHTPSVSFTRLIVRHPSCIRKGGTRRWRSRWGNPRWRAVQPQPPSLVTLGKPQLLIPKVNVFPGPAPSRSPTATPPQQTGPPSSSSPLPPQPSPS